MLNAQGVAGKSIKWGMTIDLDRCDGCGACAIACRNENNVPVAGPEQAAKDRAIWWMDLLREGEGEFPYYREQVTPTPCNHCEDAPCVKVCPVGATSSTQRGDRGQIPSRCIGCRFCTVACPYTRRYFNWEDPAYTEGELSRLNPDVATRPVGTVEKCTFCSHRIRAAREHAELDGKELTDADVHHLPACSQYARRQPSPSAICNNPDSAVSRHAQSPRAYRLLEELGTKPKVVYLRKERW